PTPYPHTSPTRRSSDLSANAGTGIPKLCTSSTPCAGVASALFYPPSTVTTIQNAVNSGFTVTLPRQLIRYVNWTGAVWIQEKSRSEEHTSELQSRVDLV